MNKDVKLVDVVKDVHKTVEMLKIELNKSTPDEVLVKSIVQSLSLRTVALLGLTLYKEGEKDEQ
jgi:hypothetical protein